MKKYKIGYTTGVFDMFHVGHLNILKKAKEQCEYLIVGVSTDELVENYKNKKTIVKFEDRKKIVEAIRYVDKVVSQSDLNKFATAIDLKYNAVFVGSDWENTPSWNEHERQYKELGIDVVYIKYTDSISSTKLRAILNK